MILPAQKIRAAKVIAPFHERKLAHGMTFGLGPAGYDVRIAQDVLLWPGRFVLASTIERVSMPDHLQAQLFDKSTWARRGVGLFNTLIDPGFHGFITLEIANHGWRFVRLRVGMPIAQLVFGRLEEPTDQPYVGKYQSQRAGPQPAILEREA